MIFLQITKLKIDSNPFAKGFRDSSRLTDFDRWVIDITTPFTNQHRHVDYSLPLETMSTAIDLYHTRTLIPHGFAVCGAAAPKWCPAPVFQYITSIDKWPLIFFILFMSLIQDWYCPAKERGGAIFLYPITFRL